MSECKRDFSDTVEDKELHEAQCVRDKSQNNEVIKSLRGYSAMMFLRKGKHKRKKSRSSLRNLSIEFKENEKLPLAVGAMTKKCEVLGFEEVSNEFTCTSSITDSYQRNTNRESRYSFRKLDDGTFAIERKSSLELNPEKSDHKNTKRSKKMCHQKGRYACTPNKICFKKRSKTHRNSSDSNDDKPMSKSCTSENDGEGECPQHDESMCKTWASFKKMVTRRKKTHSSLKKQSHQNCPHPEANTRKNCSQCASNNKGFSKLKIPCMTFYRGKKSSDSISSAEETSFVAKPSNMQTEEPGSDCERSDKALAIKYKLQRSLDAENGEIGSDVVQCPFNSTVELQPLPKQKKSMDELTVNSDITSVDKAAKGKNASNGDYGGKSEEREMDHPSDDLKEDSEVNINSAEQMLHGCMIKCYVGEKQIQDTVTSVPKADVSHEDNHIQPITESKNMENTEVAHLSNLIYSKDRLNVSLINDLSNHSIVISDPYEIMLMTTATSLVNKVIQSSIQQLVDEGAFLNHAPSKLLPRPSF
ncbi:A-kinase anchor 5 [Pelobates cultripes]|uniref:A-kinase anchor 5 n=1 Tax=Pelobates cultripes TaxID=61616 RepID=A0AAD1TNG2_PELCU|nr:A-kinase anchor 5 [Pelobates cultripes]